ncbi:MAG: phosphotransferase [bacterium]|nr:phosphotransferase [bacterium]
MIPQSVISNLAGDPEATLVRTTEEPITTSSGAATGQIVRYVGELRYKDGRIEAFRVIRKSLRPLESGRHAAFANEPGHWAYWQRELLAYSSDILPAGPGLVAPRCFGTDGNDLYLEDIVGQRETIDRAAMHLAEWQSRTSIPDLPWLTRDQLGQRIQTTVLNWDAVDADPRAVTLWNQRDELLRQLEKLPRVLAHGDYSLGNLIARGPETVALDWGTLGIAPVGSDLAHLALSASADPTPYFMEAARSHWPTQDVITGFQATLALVGSSRTHWMLSSGLPVPDWYVNFLWNNRPT